ncbi:MAG: LLM class flavin-dependent oxidoreductase, partial [Actinomycetota bacterium]
AALTGLAGEVPAISLGTGVVPLPSRHPELLAAAAATVAERSGGRLILGLGTGPAVPGALGRLRATLVALRRLFREGEAVLQGERLRLGLVPEVPPPIWIAALGPRAVRMAGEVADGVILNWCTPERAAEATGVIRAAAAEAGREPDAVTIAVYVRAALAAGTADAALAAASEYGSYPGYARQFVAMGIDPGDPASIVAAVCLTGDAGRSRLRLQAYRQAGADLPVVYPVIRPPERWEHGVGRPQPGDALATLRTLAP